MSIKYQDAFHAKAHVLIQNRRIAVIRLTPHEAVSAKDLAAAISWPVEKILAHARLERTVEASFPTIMVNPTDELDRDVFLHLSAALEFLERRAGMITYAVALRVLFEKHLTGNQALIRDGLTASARDLILGVEENFTTWLHGIFTSYPFYGFTTSSIDSTGDCPMVLPLVEQLAKDSGIFAGKVTEEILADCGFYRRSYLRRPFSAMEEDYYAVIRSFTHLVDFFDLQHFSTADSNL